MYGGGEDLKISDTLPNILMEGDDEAENEIVKPILEDLVKNVTQDLQLKHLENYVQTKMKVVEQETQAEKQAQKTEILEIYIKNVLSICIENAVSMANGGFLERG